MLLDAARRLKRRSTQTARIWRRRLAGLGDAPAILLYHRIAEPHDDPWGLSVSPARFVQQLAAMRRHRTLIGMEDLMAAIDAGDVPPRATAITFDDGYRDNFETAAPLLADIGATATVFLSTGAVARGVAYWWDELADLVLLPEHGADFTLEIGGKNLRVAWPPGSRASHSSWRAWQPPRNARQAAYVTLWTALQALAEPDRDAAITEVKALLSSPTGTTPSDPAALPVSSSLLRSWRDPVLQLGAHARSHVPLTRLSPGEQCVEITRSRDDVAALSDRGLPRGFAYPHGENDAITRRLVAEAGFCWAVTTHGACIVSGTVDRFALPRITVGNWTGKQVLAAISAAPLS